MPEKKKILLVGESWISSASHAKGFDQFFTTTAHNGAVNFLKAMRDTPYEVIHMPSEVAQSQFPATVEELGGYAAIILSDIGANTLLIHPDTWLHSKVFPNRLKVVAEYVKNGGAIMMVGGYLSFQGVNGQARYRNTPIEKLLPVSCLPYDDRQETPEGSVVSVVEAGHPVIAGLPAAWPPLLGYTDVVLLPDATLVATVGEDNHPLIAARDMGNARSLVWTSDMSAHWMPDDYLAWPGYKTLWLNCLDWLTTRS
mgnify:CR=1 FL=1